MKRQWTPEEAWAWYNDRPWIVGFNYVPACCASIFDMWQEYRHAERMPAITREIERAHEIGYNGIRLLCPFTAGKRNTTAICSASRNTLRSLQRTASAR